ncbi:NicO-domain-containing protein [Dentipellis sp. KUC8613]|nr:NicO-domain-containing protein [Dentipellis sp. KUC8613]
MSTFIRSLRGWRSYRRRRLTIFGRSALLLSSELLANAVCWIVAGILFGRSADTQPILSLALLAWTIGLRHALDADHISAIDNATRGLISLGQLPVTCGLFFSLGHSTIVIVVNVAIAISTDVADRIGGVGSVGGIVGSAVSATFLFIVGLANSIILYRILRKRRQNKRRRAAQLERGEEINADEDLLEDEGRYNQTIMMKILGPIVKFVDRPWKMYPVGVLFGFGFDTASSIALLAVSAIAKKGADGKGIPPADIVVLPLLFTAGMTLLDSVDSILMLYSYSGFPERSFALFEAPRPLSPALVEQAAIPEAEGIDAAVPSSPEPSKPRAGLAEELQGLQASVDAPATPEDPERGSLKSCSPPEDFAVPSREVNVKVVEVEEHAKKEARVKRNMMSGLSIVLTSMSILVAFSISLITIMGLIGDNCSQCQAAADAPDGGGLAGSWWRFWANANDNSGYIGAGIVGAFVFVVGSWYGARWVLIKTGRLSARPDPTA